VTIADAESSTFGTPRWMKRARRGGACTPLRISPRPLWSDRDIRTAEAPKARSESVPVDTPG